MALTWRSSPPRGPSELAGLAHLLHSVVFLPSPRSSSSASADAALATSCLPPRRPRRVWRHPVAPSASPLVLCSLPQPLAPLQSRPELAHRHRRRSPWPPALPLPSSMPTSSKTTRCSSKSKHTSSDEPQRCHQPSSPCTAAGSPSPLRRRPCFPEPTSTPPTTAVSHYAEPLSPRARLPPQAVASVKPETSLPPAMAPPRLLTPLLAPERVPMFSTSPGACSTHQFLP